MLPWTARLRSKTAAAASQITSSVQKPPPVTSPTVSPKDFSLGPIPIEPQCYWKGSGRRSASRIQSAVIDPNAFEPVLNTGDKRYLRFRSLDAAKERLDTIIHLIGASKYLTPTDFKRILPAGKHIPEWRSEGGLLNIIPVRHPVTLERLDQWLLAFSSPYHATLYHSRLMWFHQNAKINAPLPPSDLLASLTAQKSVQRESPYNRYISPTPGVIDESTGEDLARRVQEYTIFQPRQHALAQIFIPPFTDFYLNNLWWYHQWNKPDIQGRTAYPVLFHLDPPQKFLSRQFLWEFLNMDSKDRGLNWKVWDSEQGVQNIFWATYPTGNSDDRLAYHLEMGHVHNPDPFAETQMDRSKYLIRFQDEQEAKRFVRRWNGVDYDSETEGKYHGYVSPVIRAEPLWC